MEEEFDERTQDSRSDREEDRSIAARFADFLIFNDHEHNNTQISEGSRSLIYTPVEINGVPGTALVDSGTTSMFIAKKFVEENELSMLPANGIIRDGAGGNLADRIGTVDIEVRNGEKTVLCSPDVIHLEET